LLGGHKQFVMERIWSKKGSKPAYSDTVNWGLIDSDNAETEQFS